ncbi:MAG: hypothetical protein JXR14_00415 [Paracoccaceae bacterium]
MIHRTLIVLMAVIGLCGTASAQQDKLPCQTEAQDLAPDLQASFQALSDLMQPVFRKFPVYRDLIDSQSTEICFSSSLRDALGYFSPEDNSIILKTDLPRALQAGILLHELRHLQQFVSGICPGDSLAMSENARATLALEADASAISLFIANALKQEGRPAIWDALAQWETQKDIAAAYAADLAQNRESRLATSAAFKQWYASPERRENYYRASCSSYLDRQDETKALPQYQRIAPDFLERLCKMPDGAPYDCVEASADQRP